jgi:hypothetical protein
MCELPGGTRHELPVLRCGRLRFTSGRIGTEIGGPEFPRRRRRQLLPQVVARGMSRHGRSVFRLLPYFTRARFETRCSKIGRTNRLLVYENDVSVLDPDGCFKKLEDFVWARNWVYEMKGVLVVEKI